MFRDRSYQRQKCGTCGAHFWSLKQRPDCGDTPCTDYYFDSISLRSPPLTVFEAREKFLRFFQERGHEVIEPYPVVARWREDLYLTIASIAVFQPHVTKMVVPPPANPLVIAQPCIRLEDLGSVGYTLGRHLTNFIMGGHHAFNYPDKYVYFTNETVELAIEFFSKIIGVPEEEIVLKESWWEGGGNAGPCFEVAVGGLEVATLVFMMYEVNDGNYVEMPLKIVDTGYGIERIAWLTQKSPTAFHAIYGDLVGAYHKILGIEEPPQKLLWALFKRSGRLDLRNVEQFELVKNSLSRDVGLPVDEVSRYLDGAVQVYTILDHIKTAILMLSDGVVPSNSGEGYLARLVLRRVFRILAKLGVGLGDIYKLVDLQVRTWRTLFPRLEASENYIHEVLDIEYGKFRELLDKAPSIVKRYVSKSSPGLSLDEYIELYESHGIPPELAAEISSKLGFATSVPREFYSVLASRRTRAPIKKVEKVSLSDDVYERIKKLPPTRRLFHEDPYMKLFRARVIDVVDEYVVLDQTAFYPEGGGQKADKGKLRIGNSVYEVEHVLKVGDVVLHRVKPASPGKDIVGQEVLGEIDWDNRYSLMRHHTATHILLGVLRRLYGDHVWQAGAEKDISKGRLDVTHFKVPTPDELRIIEREVNRIINEARPVLVRYLPKYDAERTYGFRIYQGGVPMESTIRIVEVPGLDAEACYGTHLRSTAEVGGFKLINVEKIQDGVIRFEYVAGPQLVEYASKLENVIREAENMLGGDILEKVPKILKELSDVRKALSTYRDLYKKLVLDNIERNRVAVSDRCGLSLIVVEIPDEKLLTELLRDYIKRKTSDIVVIISRDHDRSRIEISEGADVSEKVRATDLINMVAEKMGGKGGGKHDHAVLTVLRYLEDGEIQDIKKAIYDKVKELCSNP